jgi:hypothetical protein
MPPTIRAIFLCCTVAGLAGCFAVPTVEPAIPVLSGQVSKSGVPVAGARILVSNTFQAVACQNMRTATVTGSDGQFFFSGEKTLQFAPLGGDPKPHWEVCIEYDGHVWSGYRPVGFGLQEKAQLKCDIDRKNIGEWKGICE